MSGGLSFLFLLLFPGFFEPFHVANPTAEVKLVLSLSAGQLLTVNPAYFQYIFINRLNVQLLVSSTGLQFFLVDLVLGLDLLQVVLAGR